MNLCMFADYHRWHTARQRNVPQTAADRLLNRLPLLAVFTGWSPPSSSSSSSSPPADTTDDNDSGSWYPSPVERQDIRDVMRRCIVDTDLLLTINFAVGVELNRRLRKNQSIFTCSGLQEETEIFPGESFEPIHEDQYQRELREREFINTMCGMAPGFPNGSAKERQKETNVADERHAKESHETRCGIDTTRSPASVVTEETEDTTETKGRSERSHHQTRYDEDNLTEAETSDRHQREKIQHRVLTANTSDLVMCCKHTITIKERPTIFDSSVSLPSAVTDEPATNVRCAAVKESPHHCGNAPSRDSYGEQTSMLIGTSDRLLTNNTAYDAVNDVIVPCINQHSSTSYVTKCQSKPFESNITSNQLQFKLDVVRTAILSGDDLMLTARGPRAVGDQHCPGVQGGGEKRGRTVTTGPAISTSSLRTTQTRLPTAQSMPHSQRPATNTSRSRDQAATGFGLNPSSAPKNTVESFEQLCRPTFSIPDSPACAVPSLLTDHRLTVSSMSKTVPQTPPCDEHCFSMSLPSSPERHLLAGTSRPASGRIPTYCRQLPDGGCGCTSVTEDGRLPINHFDNISAVTITTSDNHLFQSSSSERTYQQQSLLLHLQPSAQHHHGVHIVGPSGPMRLNRHRFVDRFRTLKHVIS